MSRPPRRPRSVKVEDSLWDAAHRAAAERGEVLSEVIRDDLKRYVAKHERTKAAAARDAQA